MTRKMFRLTARADGHDKPLYISMVQAFDADEARGYCRLPMPYTVKGPVSWDVEEVTIRNTPPPRDDAAKLLSEAVRLLERHVDADGTTDALGMDTRAFLAKVSP